MQTNFYDNSMTFLDFETIISWNNSIVTIPFQMDSWEVTTEDERRPIGEWLRGNLCPWHTLPMQH